MSAIHAVTEILRYALGVPHKAQDPNAPAAVPVTVVSAQVYGDVNYMIGALHHGPRAGDPATAAFAKGTLYSFLCNRLSEPAPGAPWRYPFSGGAEPVETRLEPAAEGGAWLTMLPESGSELRVLLDRAEQNLLVGAGTGLHKISAIYLVALDAPVVVTPGGPDPVPWAMRPIT